VTILGVILLFISLAAGAGGVVRVARLDAHGRCRRAKVEAVVYAAVFVGALFGAIRVLTGDWPW